MQTSWLLSFKKAQKELSVELAIFQMKLKIY